MRAAEEGLVHRSRVLLALSEAPSGHPDADRRRARSSRPRWSTGCLRAGIWLRQVDEHGEHLA